MTNVSRDAACGLPGWWRCVLVALAVVILCSCSAPLVRAQGTRQQISPVHRRGTAPAAAKPVAQSQQRDVKPAAYGVPCAPGAPCAPGSGAMPGFGGVVDPYGPLVGPSDEYLCDGGDFGLPAGVREDWVVVGLDEEDAVGHYDTVDGRTVVTPSNRVCIYAPRFAAVRRVVNVLAHEQPEFVNLMLEERAPMRAGEAQPVASSLQRHMVNVKRGERASTLFRQRQQAGGLENLQATMDVYTSLAAYANLTIIRTGEVSGAERAELDHFIESAITLTGIQAPQVVFGVKMAQAEIGVRQPGIIYQTDEPHRPRLRLIKLASRGHALPGEEIEFLLRFDNIGDQVIGNVTIVDHLSSRLEYIAESAQSSVDADFRTESNATEASILRWEIKEPVEASRGGVLRFRVRVR